MSITRLSGGLTPADGADPRTFPTIFNATADVVEANEAAVLSQGSAIASQGSAITDLQADSIPTSVTSPVAGDSLVYDGSDWVNAPKSGNAVINGDFSIWQRGTSFSNPGATVYAADRWQQYFNDANPTTYSLSQLSLTPADIQAIGYGDAQFALRATITTVGATTVYQLAQRIEDVRTFAGQQVTVSFWAKASSAVTFGPRIVQNFGSGGSAEVTKTGATNSLTTNWVRYSASVTLDSLSGKTIGGSSWLGVTFRIDNPVSGLTVDLWGVQLEAGPLATPFKLAGGGSKAAELALCQRYYQKSYSQSVEPGTVTTAGQSEWLVNQANNFHRLSVPFKVTMRTSPTITVYSPDTGTAAKIFNQTTGSDVNGAGSGSDGVFNGFVNNVAITTAALQFQYTAEAEL